MILVLSCEHGGNLVPSHYESLFRKEKSILQTHRAYDPGTEDLYDLLVPHAHFGKKNTVSRLLIEVNRSLHHSRLFSEFSKTLAPSEKNDLIETIYRPYRFALESKIRNYISKGSGPVVHISLHSFTPELNGEVRNNDIGLLFDPGKSLEKKIAVRWKQELLALDPTLKIRFNYPYLGKADGFTSYLRKVFPENYVGIELEINQGLLQNHSYPPHLKSSILRSLLQVVSPDLGKF
jgi:predicted N-formylglutamate amidohydrolase